MGAAVVAMAYGIVGRWLPLWALVSGTAALTLAPGAVAAARKTHRAAALLIVGAALGPLIAGPIYVATHPVLHVDNANDTAIDVWIDGRRWQTLAPTPATSEPPHLRLPFGPHRLAWSPKGAPAPLYEIDANLRPFGERVYSPGAAGCYWLAVTSYGDASVHGAPHGPQPIAQLVELDRVDVWFDDAPKTVRTPRILGGTLRFALQRNHACMELGSFGCDAGQRAAYVECTRSIEHPFEYANASGNPDCFEEAVRSCRIVK
ncbi:MAG: hypothetical protein ACXWUE_35185 [Polyangiales bacterium]